MIMMPYGWTLAIAAAHRSGGLLAPHRVITRCCLVNVGTRRYHPGHAATRDTRSSTRRSRRHVAVRSAIFVHSACSACGVQQSGPAGGVHGVVLPAPGQRHPSADGCRNGTFICKCKIVAERRKLIIRRVASWRWGRSRIRSTACGASFAARRHRWGNPFGAGNGVTADPVAHRSARCRRCSPATRSTWPGGYLQLPPKDALGLAVLLQGARTPPWLDGHVLAPRRLDRHGPLWPQGDSRGVDGDMGELTA